MNSNNEKRNELQKLKEHEEKLKTTILNKKVAIVKNSVQVRDIGNAIEKMSQTNREKIENKVYTVKNICSLIGTIVAILIIYLGILLMQIVSSGIEIIISSIMCLLSLVIDYIATSEITKIIIIKKINKLKNSKRYLAREQKIKEFQKEQKELEKQEKKYLKEKDELSFDLQNTQNQINQKLSYNFITTSDDNLDNSRNKVKKRTKIPLSKNYQ